MESGVEAAAGTGWAAVLAEGRPRGPWVRKGTEEQGRMGGGWEANGVKVTVDVVDVLAVEAEGVVRGLGTTSLGIEGGGRRSSVYMSSSMFDRPIIAAGWSAKWLRADSKWARAM